MTKEEFMRTDFKFKDSFANFRMIKDPYDGLKMLTTPRVLYDVRPTENLQSSAAVAQLVFTVVHELVVVDFNTQVNDS